jgi:TonB family protein
VPDSATVNAEHGEVYLGIYVSSHGKPRKIKVIHSSGFDDLDAAAVTAAATWHYVPAVRDDGNVSDWMGLRMEFGSHETGKTLKPTDASLSDSCGS